MFAYLVRRLLFGLLTLFVITFLIYALIRHMPGTPLTQDQTESLDSEISEREIKRLERIYGLDKPWYTAYFQWMGNVLRGDLGRSFRYKRAVTTVIGDRVGPTLLLSGTSLLLSYLLAVPLGLYSTAMRGQWQEKLVSVVLYMLYAIPSFVAALLLLNLFYEKMKGTPFEFTIAMKHPNHEKFSATGQILDIARNMTLPVICYTYGSLAYFSRFISSNMEEVIRQDYIRTAKAKGVGPVRIMWHHAFRNTMIPFVTMIGLTLPSLLSGSIVLEFIFNWPGMGSLFLESISKRDYPVIMGLTLMFSVLTLLGQLLADVLYAWVDPRVSYQ